MGKTLKISGEDVEALAFDDYCEDTYEVVSEGNWEDDGKYQFKSIVFKHNEVYYSVRFNRTGSYYSDYYYEWEDSEKFTCYEVELKEVTKKVWMKVK